MTMPHPSNSTGIAMLSPAAGSRRKDQTGNGHHGSKDSDPQEHGEKVLNIGDIRGASRDQAGGTEGIQFFGGKALYFAKDPAAQSGSKVCGNTGSHPDR